jgi:hypothetical protein
MTQRVNKEKIERIQKLWTEGKHSVTDIAKLVRLRRTTAYYYIQKVKLDRLQKAVMAWKGTPIEAFTEIPTEGFIYEPLPTTAIPGHLNRCYMIPVTIENLRGYWIKDIRPDTTTTGYCIVRETKFRRYEPIHSYLVEHDTAKTMLELACRRYKKIKGGYIFPLYGYYIFEESSSYNQIEPDPELRSGENEIKEFNALLQLKEIKVQTEYRNQSKRFGEIGVIVTKGELQNQLYYWRQEQEEPSNTTITEEIKRAVNNGELEEL